MLYTACWIKDDYHVVQYHTVSCLCRANISTQLYSQETFSWCGFHGSFKRNINRASVFGFLSHIRIHSLYRSDIDDVNYKLMCNVHCTDRLLLDWFPWAWNTLKKSIVGWRQHRPNTFLQSTPLKSSHLHPQFTLPPLRVFGWRMGLRSDTSVRF